MRLSVTPLAWGFGLGLGAALAFTLGPAAPRWGMALAFPSVALLLSFGVMVEDDGEEMRNLLRFALAFTTGFLGVTVPLAWIGIGRLVDAAGAHAQAVERAEEVRDALMARWAVIGLTLPGSVMTLWARARRAPLLRDA